MDDEDVLDICVDSHNLLEDLEGFLVEECVAAATTFTYDTREESSFLRCANELR